MSSARSPWSLAIGGLLALAVAVGIGRFVYTPILPFMVEALGLSKGQAGWIASANYAGYLIGALAASSPRLTGSRRRWMISALLIGAASTAAVGVLDAVWAHMAMRFIGGVASAFAFVYASALVLERLQANGRAGLSAVHFGGVGIGITLSALIVSGAVMADIGWRGQWFGAGTVSLVAACLVVWLVPEQQGRETVHAKGVFKAGLRPLILAYGLFGFGYIITATFLMAIVRDTETARHLEPVIWLVVGLTGAPSVALWMWVSWRFGILQTFALACLAEAIGVGASVLWVSPLSLVISGMLLGGTFIALTALGLIGSRTFTTGDPRQVVGWMTAAFGFGQIIGPAFAGSLYDVSGSFLPSSMTAVISLLIASLVVYGIARQKS
ncbi:MAG: YbfB/YjiJ family MFS transporter [Rhodospirillales bacterium]|nr:YbfB/YjiJ family MFS transporter [Rhodospirillales bacterium]